jgi:hypothetical protein
MEKQIPLKETLQRHHYIQSRLEKAAAQNMELKAEVKGLKGILETGLKKGKKIDFDSLRLKESAPVFSPPLHLLHPAAPL